jgi:cell division transport system ATP-binding protein
MIEMHGVSVVYPNGVQALKSVDLQVDEGNFVFVVGSTGSGKSTLLKLIYREELPSEGKVVVAGHEVTNLKPAQVPFLRRKIGVVFQDFRLLPQKTIYENLAFALRVIGTPGREIRKRIKEALELVGLADRCDSFPDQLSGGEQQRAAIARSIVNHPTLLVADEPTGNLDPDTSWGIMQVLSDINARGTTLIVASHDSQMIDKMKKRVIEIDSGRVVRDQEEGTYQRGD